MPNMMAQTSILNDFGITLGPLWHQMVLQRRFFERSFFNGKKVCATVRAVRGSLGTGWAEGGVPLKLTKSWRLEDSWVGQGAAGG